MNIFNKFLHRSLCLVHSCVVHTQICSNTRPEDLLKGHLSLSLGNWFSAGVCIIHFSRSIAVGGKYMRTLVPYRPSCSRSNGLWWWRCGGGAGGGNKKGWGETKGITEWCRRRVNRRGLLHERTALLSPKWKHICIYIIRGCVRCVWCGIYVIYWL